MSDDFQMALYLNHHYVYTNYDIPVANPVHPKRRLRGVYETGGEEVHAGHDPATPFDSYHFESVSFESIYRLLSPYKTAIGLGFISSPALALRKPSWNGRSSCKKTGSRTDSFGR